MHLAHLGEELLHPAALVWGHVDAKGQAREPRPHQGRGIRHSAHTLPARKQTLQPRQGDTGEHGDQQPARTSRRRRCHGLELLGLNRQQHHRRRPGCSCISSHSQAVGLGQAGGGGFASNNGPHTLALHQACFQQGKQQSLGHTAQAHYAEGWRHSRPKWRRPGGPRPGWGPRPAGAR